MQYVGHQALPKGFSMWQHKVKAQFDSRKAKDMCEALCSFLLRKPGAQLQTGGRYRLSLRFHSLLVSPWTMSPTASWNTLLVSWRLFFRSSQSYWKRSVFHLNGWKVKMQSHSVLFGHFIQRWSTEDINDCNLCISSFTIFSRGEKPRFSSITAH